MNKLTVVFDITVSNCNATSSNSELADCSLSPQCSLNTMGYEQTVSRLYGFETFFLSISAALTAATKKGMMENPSLDGQF